MAQQPERPTFPIQFVSRVTGLNAHTIRAWERRYQVVSPRRSDAGRRLYGAEEIERLQLLNELVGLGHQISKIASLENEELRALFERYSENSDASKRKTTDAQELSLCLQNLLLAVTRYRLDIICHELEKVSLRHPPAQYGLELIAPVLREIGVLVEQGKLSIAQEHALSSLLRGYILMDVFEQTRTGFNQKKKRVAVCTPSEEYHEFGILIGALVLYQFGYEVVYLGPNIPSESVCQVVQQMDTKIALIGATSYLVDQCPQILKNWIAEVAACLPENCELWLGGLTQSSVSEKNVRLFPTLEKLAEFLQNH